MSSTNAVMDAIETILAWDLPDEAVAIAISTHTGDFAPELMDEIPLQA
tara:strand:- start:209 stop:352 length:144 start_codon:yes stop_codon:yes gene_type:complete